MTVYMTPSMTATDLEAAPAVLTPKQVGDLLGICPRTVQKMAQRGELPGVKVGNKWRFSRAKIVALVGIDG